MLKEYDIKVTSVDYSVTEEDLIDDIIEEEDYINKIKEIKAELPQVLYLTITCEPEDLEDEIADAISAETGWLNNSFTYHIISETEIEEE